MSSPNKKSAIFYGDDRDDIGLIFLRPILLRIDVWKFPNPLRRPSMPRSAPTPKSKTASTTYLPAPGYEQKASMTSIATPNNEGAYSTTSLRS